jgi:hypothetical protein
MDISLSDDIVQPVLRALHAALPPAVTSQRDHGPDLHAVLLGPHPHTTAGLHESGAGRARRCLNPATNDPGVFASSGISQPN